MSTVGPIPLETMESLTGSVEILAWTTFADLFTEYPNTLNAISQYFTDYAVTTTTTEDASELGGCLENADIFLIPEQEGGSYSYYQALGLSWSEVLTDFVQGGGQVLVCGSVDAIEIVNASGLMTMYFADFLQSGTMAVVETDHPLVADVPTELAIQNATIMMDVTDPDAVTVVSYFGNAAVAVKTWARVVLCTWATISLSTTMMRSHHLKCCDLQRFGELAKFQSNKRSNLRWR